jgi:3'(2'), 5'-bisphosphate nucleotidase
VLGCPNLDALFVAVRGQGAVQRSLADGSERPIRVSASLDPQFVESVDAGHSDHGTAHRAAARMGATREPIRMDSQAKYGVVARGEASVYLRVPTRAHPVENIWDHAPGAIVVEEAGGRVTDARGAPLQWGALDRNEGILATNGALHDAVIEAVRRVRSG